MTLLTPRYNEQAAAAPLMNGSGRPHIIEAHEPTREGEHPANQPVGAAAGAPHKPTPAAAAGPLKIALIGTAPSSRMLAPFGDPSWTIWACSPGNMNALPRVDAWFELHSNLLWPEHKSYGEPYIAWLQQQSFPIFMQDQTLVPKATVFPKDELVAEFGDDFFTSSFAWMMAMAMKQGAVEIALYGIDMASRDEYIRQRPGFFFFRHLAKLRGINVSAPHESDIMQSPALYAYVDSTPFGRKIMARRAEVSGRINGMTGQRDQLTNSITYLQGAMEDLDYFESIWGGVANDMGRLQFQNSQLQQEVLQWRALAAMPQPVQQASQWSMSASLTSEPIVAAAPATPVGPRARRGRKSKTDSPTSQERRNG